MRLLFASLLAVLTALFTPAAISQPSLPLIGKTAVVTGSTDGLGRAVALSLAEKGAHVVVHGRNAERGEALVKEIAGAGRGSAVFFGADLASIQEARKFADTIAARYPKIDILVNNAGVAVARGDPRKTSADGHELQFAVNYLAGWIITNRLRPNLAAARPSRVINISSGAASPIDFADVMLEKPGASDRGYGQSKLAQVSMTVELAPAFARNGITMIALHPATMMPTGMVTRDLRGRPRDTLAEGRDHVMGLILSPNLQTGAFYVKGRVASPSDPQPSDPKARKQLVALSTRLTGVGVN